MMRNSILLVLFLFSLTTFAHADTYYCGNTAQYIQTGDDESAVREKCGSPKSITTRTEKKVESEEITQWFYNFAAGNTNNMNYDSPSLPPVLFEIKDGKILNIIIANNQKVQNTSVCGNQLKIGDSQELIVATCAMQPTWIDHTTREVSKGSKKITVWRYEMDNLPVATVLEFEDGKLERILVGQQ